jgi:inosose dehydratase
VDDVSNPHPPPWERVLDEAAHAGFSGLALGPYGYMPLAGARIEAALEKRGLRFVAGTIFDDLVTPRNRERLLRQADEICALIIALPPLGTHRGQRFPAPYLTVMGWGHDERDCAAGRSDRAPRLGAAAWPGMVANIRAVDELADELERIANDVPGETAGLCLDTGHLDYAGMDPVATLRRYADRTDHIHLKDVDGARYADVMSRRIRFFDARVAVERLTEALGDLRIEAHDPGAKARCLGEVKRVTDTPKAVASALSTDAQVIGAVQRPAEESTVMMCAARTMPGALQALWQAAKGGFHMEYGHSCMGYEPAGAMWIKIAAPERCVVRFVGDGSYMMANSELATALSCACPSQSC